MPLVTWWALLSACCAPVVLISGWTTAAVFQAPGYDPVTDTISSLAADGASDRWLMASALAGLGVCHLVTALGLRAAALAGRVALAAGGVSSILVALSPNAADGGSLRHSTAAALGFACLALWPFLAADHSKAAPWVLKPALCFLVTALILLGAAWFLTELRGHGAAGVSERVLTTAQALWPLIVAASCVRHARAAGGPNGLSPGPPSRFR